MAVKIRLQRMGAHKKPLYRVVVADTRYPRDGRCIEALGIYDPRNVKNPVVLETERAAQWIKQGAQVTDTVRSLLQRANVPGVS